MKFDVSSSETWLRSAGRLVMATTVVLHFATAFVPGSRQMLLFDVTGARSARSSVTGNLAMGLPSRNDEPNQLANIASGVFTKIFAPLSEGKKAVVKALAGSYNQEQIRSRLEKLIREKPVLMLSFTTCPYCLKAKHILNEKGAKYEVLELDKDPDGGPIRAEMAQMVGRTSVPAIWIGQTFVGGCNDGPMGGVVKLNESGQLYKLLQEVGAI